MTEKEVKKIDEEYYAILEKHGIDSSEVRARDRCGRIGRYLFKTIFILLLLFLLFFM